jgi:hypothetical protein
MAKSYIVAILHAAAILALISVPGLWWNSWQTMRRRLQAAFVVLPGILGIAALGLIYWRLGPSASPAYGYGWVAVIGVLFIDLMRHAIVTKFWRRRQHGFEDRGQIAIIVWLTLFVQTFAFGVNPLPVAQEFRAGSIIPGRMVASPPDNDIPYRTAVYFFYGKHGHKDSAIYFGDWSIASRGPLVPFAINGLFHIFGGHPSDPPSYKRNPWPRGEPGADLARSFGWLMNAMVVLGAFDLMRALGVSFRRRYVALAWLALSPVALINTAFLWPKLFATYFIMCSAGSVLRGCYILAGALISLAWLSHPVGALLAPAIAIMALLSIYLESGITGSSLATMAGVSLKFGLCACLCILPWGFIFFGFATMLIYWGFSGDGLGRNCLEPLTVAAIALTASAINIARRWVALLLILLFLENRWVEFSGFIFDKHFSWDLVRMDASCALAVSTVAAISILVLGCVNAMAPEDTNRCVSAVGKNRLMIG